MAWFGPRTLPQKRALSRSISAFLRDPIAPCSPRHKPTSEPEQAPQKASAQCLTHPHSITGPVDRVRAVRTEGAAHLCPPLHGWSFVWTVTQGVALVWYVAAPLVLHTKAHVLSTSCSLHYHYCFYSEHCRFLRLCGDIRSANSRHKFAPSGTKFIKSSCVVKQSGYRVKKSDSFNGNRRKFFRYSRTVCRHSSTIFTDSSTVCQHSRCLTLYRCAGILRGRLGTADCAETRDFLRAASLYSLFYIH